MTLRTTLLGTTVLLGLATSPATAATFSWSYTDGASNTGGGSLIADETAPNSGEFNISSISGFINGTEPVLGGPLPGLAGYAGTGTTIFWTSTAPQVFDPLNPFFFTNYLGFAFKVGSSYFALYENTGNFDVTDAYACGGAEIPYCLLGPGVLGSLGEQDTKIGLTNFSVNQVASVVPIPAALPLLASGLGALGVIGWRRKRKAATASAA